MTDRIDSGNNGGVTMIEVRIALVNLSTSVVTAATSQQLPHDPAPPLSGLCDSFSTGARCQGLRVSAHRPVRV